MTSVPISTGLMVVHGNRSETLRALLVEWLRRYPLSPLENDVILVQSNGVAQWLKLALAADPGSSGVSGGCGIAAALELLLPSRFLWHVYRCVLGRDHVPEVSGLDKDPLVWRLMRLLPSVVAEPVYLPLQRFLENDDDLRKRFQLAGRLADLFDQYQVYRADWLAAWASGDDVLIDAHGVRVELPHDQRWQAALWRELLRDLVGSDGDGPTSTAGRADVHAAFLHRAKEWPEADRPGGLPRRVIVFGISSMPRQSLEVLAVMARWTQVLMFVHNPCEHYWADIVADRELLRAEASRQRRREGSPSVVPEEALHLHAHPLLAAWGRQGRDFIGLLDEHDSATNRERYLKQFTAIQKRIDLFESGGQATLLQQLQDDIRDLRPLHESRSLWPKVDPGIDASIRFHIAHGPQREVEILHDQLLAAFDADASLQPRDIIVMVPDIDSYAPHVRAVFGLMRPDDARHIPFSLADQRSRRVDPLVTALEHLLGLPQSRMAASDVLDLLEVPALRRRFRIAESDVPKLHEWIRGANVRWGLDSAHRASHDLPRIEDPAAPCTWLFGLRRMLLGYAVGRTAEAWHGIEPYDEIGGLDAVLIGPLVSLVDALEKAVRDLRAPATVSVWCERLRNLMTGFFETEDEQDVFTMMRLETALQRWQETCEAAELDDLLPLSIVGEHWLSQLDAGGLSQRFFGGSVTFATLMPMRAIPFRHVCLLGMNDGDFPRARTPTDFDLMGRDYRPGDRSRREDDRYLFLDALLSARDRLHVSWVGRSIRDNADRPASVLVEQLRHHIASGWSLAGDGDATEGGGESGDRLLAALTVEHRLQPFSVGYFPSESRDSRLFTYAHEWRSVADRRAWEVATHVSKRLPTMQRDEPLSMRELAAFLKDPVKTFFNRRLNVHFEMDDPVAEDHEPFGFDGLGRWQVLDSLMSSMTNAIERGVDAGAEVRDELARIRGRGDLPSGGFGDLIEEELGNAMTNLLGGYRATLANWPTAMASAEEVSFTVEADEQILTLIDRVDGLRTNVSGARARVALETSNLVDGDGRYRSEKLIAHWISHLAANVAGLPASTIVLSPKGTVTLGQMSVVEASACMEQLMTAWMEGMTRPLPLAVKTGFAQLAEGDGSAAARRSYETGEWAEVVINPYLRRAFPTYEALAASGEFAQLSRRLLGPLKTAIPVGANGERVFSAGGDE